MPLTGDQMKQTASLITIKHFSKLHIIALRRMTFVNVMLNIFGPLRKYLSLNLESMTTTNKCSYFILVGSLRLAVCMTVLFSGFIFYIQKSYFFLVSRIRTS